MKKTAPLAILVLGGLLLSLSLILLARGVQAPYADMLPAPDGILWEEGDETTLWLNTNLDDVEVRIATVDFGIGTLRRVFPESGASVALGRGEGCLPWAVESIEVYQIGDTGNNKRVLVQGNIARGSETGAIEVLIRVYPQGGDVAAVQDDSATSANNNGLGGVSSVIVAADGSIYHADVLSGSDSFTNASFIIPGSEGVWVIEASYSERFPATSRVTISGDVSDPDSWVPAEAGAEELKLRSDMGVGLIACSESDDVLITLHDDEGGELNRWLVDIHADPDVSTPTTAPTAIIRTDLRVCVDSADDRRNFLDGWEYVGEEFEAEADFGLFDSDIDSATIDEVRSANTFAHFFVAELDGSALQLRVSPAGAADASGLADRDIYPIEVTAVQVAGSSSIDGTIVLGVWLDTSTLSPDDDGRCS